jgi:hypothetical protein
MLFFSILVKTTWNVCDAQIDVNHDGSLTEQEFIKGNSQRHILRDRWPSTAACPACWGDGNKRIEIVYSEEKNILYHGPTRAARQYKISFTGTTSPRKTNQGRTPLKVHKHEKFFFTFLCRNRNLMVPRACNTRFLKIVFDSAEIFDF